MGKVCILKLCPHFKKRPKLDQQVGLHQFPADPQLRKVWKEWVLEKNGLIIKISDKTHGLCSSDFTQDCFRPGNLRLKPDAKPSVAPELTSDYAFKCGLISSREDFPEFFAQLKSKGESGRQDAGCLLNVDNLPLQERTGPV